MMKTTAILHCEGYTLSERRDDHGKFWSAKITATGKWEMFATLGEAERWARENV